MEQWNLDSGSSIPENSPGRDSGSHNQKFSKTLEFGEYKGIYWILCPWGGENSRYCFSSKGRRWGNCKFCKIADGKQGDITGIYREKCFIKGECITFKN